MKDKLSALMDGELTAAEQQQLHGELAQDSEMRATWERYHLVRSVLRNEDAVPVVGDVAERVALALAAEADIVPHPAWSQAWHSRVARVGGSLAIAASVAAIAIFGLQALQRNQDHSPTQTLQAQAPLGTEQNSALRVGSQMSAAEREARLNRYLVEHNEFSPSSNLKGMMAYGRVVSHENDR